MNLNTCLIFFSITFKVQAFWWQPTTTETPASGVKHIPLTYFRTYTYQPLTGGPFTFPFAFGNAAQTPILNGGRYEHFTYPTAQQFYSGPYGPKPPPTTTTAPTTPTTTTTTSTTPAPTTTTSTSTTTSTTSTTTSTPLTNKFESIVNSGGGTYGPVPPYESSMYPTYNRRLYMSNNFNSANYYRPNYPYPASLLQQQQPQERPPHVQFVPCMCPVSVGVPSGLPITGGSGGVGMTLADPSNNLYIPQARSSGGGSDADDEDMEMPMDEQAEDTNKEKSKIFSESSQATNDEALLSDEIQKLDTNNMDNSYRKPRDLVA